MSGNKCNFCYENGKPAHKWIEPKPYSGEVGKLTITHDCQVICRGFTNIIQQCSVRNAPFKFTLTQAFVDWVRKHHKSLFSISLKEALNVCPDCRIRELERDISLSSGSEKNELKEALKELRKITGKNNDDNNRERERERERETNFSTEIWNCQVGGYN